jgi:hypothetical protein
MKFIYTIKGQVIQGPPNGIVDNAGYLSKLGIIIGSAVSYVLAIDLLSPGFTKKSDGTISMPTVQPSFFAQYISGTTLTPNNYVSSYQGISENNYGTVKWLNPSGGPSGGERYMNLSKGNHSLLFADMLAGPDFFGMWHTQTPAPGLFSFGTATERNIIYDSNGNESSFYFESNITQVEVSDILTHI